MLESACTHARLDHDIRDLFMGHTGSQSKTYRGKSRGELEYYYEMVESKITIQIDESNDEIDRLYEELLKTKQDDKSVIEQLKVEIQEKSLESTKKIDSDHNLLLCLVNQIQEKSSRQIELIEMIDTLRKKIRELKNNFRNKENHS